MTTLVGPKTLPGQPYREAWDEHSRQEKNIVAQHPKDGETLPLSQDLSYRKLESMSTFDTVASFIETRRILSR